MCILLMKELYKNGVRHILKVEPFVGAFEEERAKSSSILSCPKHFGKYYSTVAFKEIITAYSMGRSLIIINPWFGSLC